MANDCLEFWDDECNNLPFAKGLEKLIDNSILLPYRNEVIKIILSYLLLPEHRDKDNPSYRCVPYLYSHGIAGSGKSTLGILASALHGITPTAGASTPASIRNAVNQHGWLVWDDLQELFFTNPVLYAYLKVGYKYKGLTTVASQNTGENVEYYTFCPKIFSSISNFFLKEKWSEIFRRLIIIPHKKLDAFKQSELLPYENNEYLSKDEDGNYQIDKSLLINLGVCDLSFLRKLYLNYQISIELNFRELAEKYRSRKRGFKLPKELPSNQWEIISDLIAIGVASEIFGSPDEAVRYYLDYFELKENVLFESSNPLGQILTRYVAEQTKELIDEGIEFISINPEHIKNYVNKASKLGWLDVIPSPYLIAEEMGKLGFTLQHHKDKMLWVLE